MTAAEWLSEVAAAVRESFPNLTLDAQVVRGTRVKVRLKLDEERLLDLFFREETGRIDYSLVISGVRAFGIDNLDGWHEHPLEDPQEHRPCAEPTPAEAIRRLRVAVDGAT